MKRKDGFTRPEHKRIAEELRRLHAPIVETPLPARMDELLEQLEEEAVGEDGEDETREAWTARRDGGLWLAEARVSDVPAE